MTLADKGMVRALPAGFTLVEALVVIVTIGLMLAIAAPRVAAGFGATNVRNARNATANLYAKARVTALQTMKQTTLNVSGGRVWITTPGPLGVDTVGGVTNLTAEYGVTVTSGGSATVLPTGLVNANVPLVVGFAKGSARDSLVISGYGRIQ